MMIHKLKLAVFVCVSATAVMACGDDDDDQPAIDAAVDASAADATVDAAADSGVDAQEPDAAPPCSQAPACPSPGAGRTMICGRIFDTETSTPAADADGLRVSFFDALAVATNPEGAAPEFSVTADECGYFVSADATHAGVTVPTAAPLVAVGVDDVAAPDAHVFTVVALSVSAGAKLDGIHGYATLKATDAKWSGGLDGASLAEQGVYLAIYIDPAKPAVGPYAGAPVAGVTILSDDAEQTGADFYFENTDVLVRSQAVGSQANGTGANGSALLVNQPIANFTGRPAPRGCTWPSLIGATVPNAVYVQEFLLRCE
jgi:hypothetical protein